MFQPRDVQAQPPLLGDPSVSPFDKGLSDLHGLVQSQLSSWERLGIQGFVNLPLEKRGKTLEALINGDQGKAVELARKLALFIKEEDGFAKGQNGAAVDPAKLEAVAVLGEFGEHGFVELQKLVGWIAESHTMNYPHYDGPQLMLDMALREINAQCKRGNFSPSLELLPVVAAMLPELSPRGPGGAALSTALCFLELYSSEELGRAYRLSPERVLDLPKLLQQATREETPFHIQGQIGDLLGKIGLQAIGAIEQLLRPPYDQKCEFRLYVGCRAARVSGPEMVRRHFDSIANAAAHAEEGSCLWTESRQALALLEAERS